MEAFGRYQLRRRIGTGGMAEVFVAKAFGAEGFVKDVVIKRILPAFGEDPEFVRMFINEARLAAKLQHANIVQIYDFNHVEGVYYIAMEWVDGLDLRSVMSAARRRQIALPARLAIHVGVETLKGLHHAHTRAEGGEPLSVVHRDISPHNLLVSFAGEVKITDFGIAKAAAVSAATRRGSVKGKLAYMSPEQVGGHPVDARSDLFSLGVVLWELLAGRRLYQADSEGELFAKVQQAEVPPLAELNPELPGELEVVVRRLLASRVESRFQFAAEALGELGGLARIDDGLELASYLEKLLPEQAGRDRRGQTEALEGAKGIGAAGSVAVAPPDAPTHTRAAGEVQEVPAPAGAPIWAEPVVVSPFRDGLDGRPPSPPTPPPAETAAAGRAAPGSRRALLVALALGVCCGGLGWWIAGRLARGAAGKLPPSAALRIEAPSGSLVLAEGVPVGEAPVTIHGTPGARLRLEARRGGATVAARDQVLGAAPRVVLGRADAGQPRPPDAGAPDQSDARSDDGAVRRVAERVKRQPAPRALGAGRLSVFAVPWARVKIDNKDVGQTPLLEHPLSAGPHQVELHNSELGKRDRRQVVIQPGKLEKIRISWD